MNREQERSQLRTIVRGAYDIQKLRVQMGNRIVANFKAKLGQPASEAEEVLDKEAKKILNDLRLDYKKITDGVKTFPRQKSFKGTEVISSYTELCLLTQYLDLERAEQEHFKRLGQILQDYPIYTTFLQQVKGIGPAMAGVIISEIDIFKARYASSLWKYAGLDVAEDGRGRSRKAEHLVLSTYIDREGNEQQKKGITFNPFLKTKLTGVLGASFLRAGDNLYAREYYGYKNRLENHPAHTEKTKKHRHNMANRYMIKRFLVDLYEHWRDLEQLPRNQEYSMGKLGMQHVANW